MFGDNNMRRIPIPTFPLFRSHRACAFPTCAPTPAWVAKATVSASTPLVGGGRRPAASLAALALKGPRGPSFPGSPGGPDPKGTPKRLTAPTSLVLQLFMCLNRSLCHSIDSLCVSIGQSEAQQKHAALAMFFLSVWTHLTHATAFSLQSNFSS